jgi:hypothetical protein
LKKCRFLSSESKLTEAANFSLIKCKSDGLGNQIPSCQAENTEMDPIV